jgi:hypothetical protein
MVNKGKGVKMGRAGCEWVRLRLPLLVGDSAGVSREEGDLHSEERARIEHHLAHCTPCREHRAGLEQGMAMLGVAAAEPWAGPGTPSLWPALAERIQRHHDRVRPRWSRFLQALCPERIRVVTDRVRRGYDNVRAELPLQLAWTRDSLKERAERGLGRESVQTRLDPGRSLRVLSPRLVLGASLTAVISLLVALTLVHRQRSLAEAQIVVNATPAMVPQAPLPEPRQESRDVITATLPVTHSSASDSLAQADSTSPAKPPGSGSSLPAKVAGTATAAATSMPTSSPQYDFDLEHGTPMPPETRGGKPAY